MSKPSEPQNRTAFNLPQKIRDIEGARRVRGGGVAGSKQPQAFGQPLRLRPNVHATQIALEFLDRIRVWLGAQASGVFRRAQSSLRIQDLCFEQM